MHLTISIDRGHDGRQVLGFRKLSSRRVFAFIFNLTKSNAEISIHMFEIDSSIVSSRTRNK